MKVCSAPLSVSIAMATFNGARFLQAQLDSLAAQTLLPMELVVTDDGSTDETIEILEKFSKSAPFEVRIYRNSDRLGFGDNFLLAVSHCRGQLISFCDQDDIWLPTKLSNAVLPFEDNDVVMTSHNAEVINGNGMIVFAKSVRYHSKSETKTEKRYWSVYSGFTLTIRNHALLRISQGVGLRPHRDYGFHHDQFIFFLYTIWGKVGAIELPLVKYRRHGQNASGATEIEECRKKIDGLESAYRVLRRRCLMVASMNWPSPSEVKCKLRPALRTARDLRMRIRVYDNDISTTEKFVLILRNAFAGVYADSIGYGLGRSALVADSLWAIHSLFKRSLESPSLERRSC